MRIPSYDDLTPSIPDISPLDVFAAVERLMPAAPPVALREPVASDTSAAARFACVYTPEPSAAARETLAAIARAFSPRIERYGDAAVLLDVSGLGRLLGDAQSIGTELDRAVRTAGSRMHVAVAPTQTAAILLAIARPTLTVVTSDVASALAPLPLTALEQLAVLTRSRPEPRAPRLHTRPIVARSGAACDPASPDRRAPNAGARGLHLESRCFETLRRWGVTTVGELAALPAAELAARLGADGSALHRRATGIDLRPLAPDPDTPRFVQSMELEWPIDGLEPLSFVLARLLDPLSASLERADRGAAAVRLELRLVTRAIHARVLQLPAAMRDARVLRTLLLLDLEGTPPSAAIDTVTIEADPAPARIVQHSLLERATPSAETIATLTARLNALVGESRCGSPVVVDTYRPDGFAMWQFAGSLGSVRPTRSAGAAASRVAEGAGGAGGAPASAGSPVLRRFRPPVAVRVTVAAGRPVRIAIDRRSMPGGRVEQYSGPWRTSGGWWEGGARWDRDEWDLALSDGSLCRIYRDRISGTWFLDGVFD